MIIDIIKQVKADWDFAKGRSDCDLGVEHREGKSLAYDEGYAHQYDLDSVADENTRCF